jgi:hypothetical protein
MNVEIDLPGGFAVQVDGQPIPATEWRRRHAASLVKLLALAPRRSWVVEPGAGQSVRLPHEASHTQQPTRTGARARRPGTSPAVTLRLRRQEGSP